MAEMLDTVPYVTPTRFSGVAGVFLARALLTAAPAERSARVQGALHEVREAGETLRAVARERMRRAPKTLRPLDSALDGGWLGLREAIVARSRLTGHPLAERAGALAATLFPDGLGFLRASYSEQWAMSQLHLERIEEENLQPEIDAVGAGDFVPFIREAQAAFGEALGVGETGIPVDDTTALSRATSALADAIADYGRILAGEVDRNDPGSVARFREAVAPIDRLRAMMRARRPSDDEPTAQNDTVTPDAGDPNVGVGGGDIDDPEGGPELEEPLPPVEPVVATPTA